MWLFLKCRIYPFRCIHYGKIQTCRGWLIKSLHWNYDMPRKSGQVGNCRLCSQEGPLELSHIIPAFVHKWQKATGGPIRSAHEPNRRIQDGFKKYWLCRNCENRFSVSEKAFSEKIFHHQNAEPKSLIYGSWFSYFGASLAWRTLEFALEGTNNPNFFGNQKYLFDSARENWQNFLLGSSRLSNQFPIHVFMFKPENEIGFDNLPVNWNRYHLRHIGLSIAQSKNEMMTYTKLGPFTFFGMIQHKKKDWKGTLINRESGRFPPASVTMPDSTFLWFKKMATVRLDAVSQVSSRQRKLILESYKQQLQNSDPNLYFQALMHDYKMFGGQVFKGV